MPQDVAALVNVCATISDNRKPHYLTALNEIVNARLLTADDVIVLKSLWANNLDSVYAFCELVKRIGSQNEHVLLYNLARFAELALSAAHQIHLLLQLHLLWLPAHKDVKSPMRSTIMLLHLDPILLQPILQSDTDEGLIDIDTLMPFSAEQFHQQGVRIDDYGMVFVSQESIANLNSITPSRRPNANAHVVPLTVNNMDFDFIRRYHVLSQLLRQPNFLQKSLDECLEVMRCAQALPAELMRASLLKIKKALLPTYYHAEFELTERQQFILWFGDMSLENNEYGFLSVIRRFAERVANLHCRSGMLQWICDYGDIMVPPITINLLVSTFCELYPNHPELLIVVRETANQLNLKVWERLLVGAQQLSRHELLSLCRATLSQDGREFITDWVAKLNASGKGNFAFLFIHLLFLHCLLTAKELAALYFDSRFANQFSSINTYFNSQKAVLLSAIDRALLQDGVQPAAGDGMSVNFQHDRARMTAQLQSRLNAYRDHYLIAVTESGVTSYQPKGVLFGAALFPRASTRNAAIAFNQLNSTMQMDIDVIIALIRDAAFKKQAGAFWEMCCREFDTAFSAYEAQMRALVRQPDWLMNYFFRIDQLNESELHYLLQLCTPTLKKVIKEFVVNVRCEYGLNASVFDVLSHDADVSAATMSP